MISVANSNRAEGALTIKNRAYRSAPMSCPRPSVRSSQPLEAPSGTQKWMIKNSFQRAPKHPKVHRFALSNSSQRGGTGMKT